MYTDMTGSRGEELNLENTSMQQEFDRGYKKEQFLIELDEWKAYIAEHIQERRVY